MKRVRVQVKRGGSRPRVTPILGLDMSAPVPDVVTLLRMYDQAQARERGYTSSRPVR